MRSSFRCGVLVLLLIWLGGGGCYWLRYEALARTHVDLLVSMVTKLEDVTARGGVPARMAEYRYPLSRARDFIRIVEGRRGDRPSLQELRGLCDAYEAALDAAVRAGSGGLADTVPLVRARAAVVLAALDREAAG